MVHMLFHACFYSIIVEAWGVLIKLIPADQIEDQIDKI